VDDPTTYDADGDGVSDYYDPFPNDPSMRDPWAKVTLTNKSTGEESFAYVWVDQDGNMIEVPFGNYNQMMDQYESEHYDSDGSYILNNNSDIEMSDTYPGGPKNWSDFVYDLNQGMADVGSSSQSNKESNEYSDVINDANYHDYVQKTPEPVYIDTDFRTSPDSTTSGTDNELLEKIEGNTKANLQNQAESAKYWKSIDSTLRKMQQGIDGLPGAIGSGSGEAEYGGPTAGDIGNAVADAVANATGNDGNGTGEFEYDRMAEKNRDYMIGEHTMPTDHTDLMPDSDPGHGHGVQSWSGGLTHIETKLNEWWTDWSTNTEVSNWFDNSGIQYTNPDSTLCISSIGIYGKETGNMCYNFAAWQSTLAMIGNILYAFVALWWGIWIFRG
jgi:hypothetical protein